MVFAGGAFTATKGTATWLNPAAELGIIALPVGLLMIAGELDLSVGSVLAASSMTLAIVSGIGATRSSSGSLIALGLGLAVGFINGFIVTRSKVPSFVVTLATNFALAGLALWLTRAHHRVDQRRDHAGVLGEDPVRQLRERQLRSRDLLVDRRHRGRRLDPARVALRQLDLRGRR